MITGIGTDLIEVERVERVCRKNARFVERVFTKAEAEFSFRNKKNPYMHLAACWAAKESFFKATNIRCRFRDVEVTHESSGKPYFNFGPSLEGKIDNLRVHLTISHIKEYATATVVVETAE
ncbi:holo-ACP synthase [bacterium]|nr:holo-ACP synthase [bacterium]